MLFRRTHNSFRRDRRCRAFTLVEVAIAIVVVGTGVVAVQAMVAASTRSTAINDEIQTATMLARSMHERCLNLDRPTLIALDNVEYSPPLDSQAVALTELRGYKQRVDVDYVDPANIKGTTTSTDAALLRVTVTVLHNSKNVLQTSRLLATTKQD